MPLGTGYSGRCQRHRQRGTGALLEHDAELQCARNQRQSDDFPFLRHSPTRSRAILAEGELLWLCITSS